MSEVWRHSMDNPYYDWSPAISRPALQWPDGERLALVVVLALEHAEWYPPAGSGPAPALRTRSYPAEVDVHALSQFEYGNRVGVFRVVELLESLGVVPTIAIDVSTVHNCPRLVDWLRLKGFEVVAHGISPSRMITEALSEPDERAYIDETLTTLGAAFGRAPRGWLGIERSESTRTTGLLAEAGIDYVCDWPNDEQPHVMRVPHGRMTNLPLMELDDVRAFQTRFLTAPRYGRVIREQFDRLYADGATSGRLLGLFLHPYAIGQPFRIRHLAEALRHMTSRAGVWTASASEVVDAFNGAR